MSIYDFINSDEYKEYIENNKGIYLNNTTITTDFIERFINSDKKTRLLNLGYSVFLKESVLEDKLVDYCYRPYIVLEKIPNTKINISDLAITMTEIKQMTQGYVHNSKVIYSLDCTYVRDCDRANYAGMPNMPFLAKVIDKHMKATEEALMEKCKIGDEYELHKILSEKIKVLDSVIYSKNPKFDIGIYVKAQDKYQHKHTFNDCYYFKINRIGARYCCEVNSGFEMLQKI